MTIGIDHLSVYTPAQYLDTAALAEARGVDPKKYSVGIGIREFSVPAPDEDVVVLAANAGHAALAEAGVSPADVGLLVVGTESAVDNAKPTATHVHELLGVGPRCRVYDTIHACAGGTYGVLSALDWLAASESRRYALVIASDVARYARRSAGEPTQGAAAVAMLLSRNPRLLSLRELSVYSKSVYDFWKPLGSAYPVVDGMLSVQSYTEAAMACFSRQPLRREAAFAYHTPYPKLVEQTHARVVRQAFPGDKAVAHLQNAVAPGLEAISRIGNTYTASLWVNLYALLEASGRGPSLPDGCYIFSYGSGCGAALIEGTFAEGAHRRIARFSLADALAGRRPIDMAEYDRLMDLHEMGPVEGKLPPSAAGTFRLAGIRGQRREYARRIVPGATS